MISSFSFIALILTFIGSSDRLKQYWGTSFRILTLSEKVGEIHLVPGLINSLQSFLKTNFMS